MFISKKKFEEAINEAKREVRLERNRHDDINHIHDRINNLLNTVRDLERRMEDMEECHGIKKKPHHPCDEVDYED